MSDVSEGPGWWQASDGKWYRPEQHPNYLPPPPPTAALTDSEDTPTDGTYHRGHSIRILIRFITLVGVLVVIAGVYLWHLGSMDYMTCNAVNALVAPLVAPTHCSQTLGHNGFLLFLSGIGVLVVGMLVRIAEVGA